MKIDKEGFNILENGYQQDLKRNEALIRAEIEKDSRFNNFKTNENISQKRMLATQTPKGMEHTKQKAINDTEKSIQNQNQALQFKKEQLVSEKMEARKKELESQIFGEQGKRQQIKETLAKMDKMKSEETRRKAENAKEHFQKVNTSKDQTLAKKALDLKNNVIEKNNHEKLTAAYKNVAEGKSLSPIHFEKKQEGKSIDGR